MKTTIFLSILFLSLPRLSFAQQYEYLPFPTENASWTYYSFWQNDPDWNGINLQKYVLTDKDTIIDNQSYNVLEYRNRSLSCGTLNILEELPDLKAWKPDEFFAGIREENKKVYIHRGNNEILLYDFNAEVGDTTAFGYMYDYRPRQITEIDTIEVNGTLRKRFYFGSVEVIEEIGNVSFLVSEGPMFICAEINDEVIYEKEDGRNCVVLEEYDPDFELVIFEHCPKYSADSILNSLKVYPNPSLFHFNLKTTRADHLYKEFRIYDIVGRLVYQGRSLSRLLTIRSEKWRPGIYILHFQIGESYRIEKLIKK